MDKPENEIKVKAYTKGELARMYKVNIKTFTLWISPHLDYIGEPIGRILNPSQVSRIFERLGLP